MLEGKSIQGTKQMLMFVNIAIVFSVALGIAVFFSGVSEANSKKDFRIIEETYLPSDKRVDEKYLFKDEDQMDKQYYIVLYETVDQYVSASLAFDNGVIVKDINRQKIISKENINTYYCYDIEKFFESEEMMQSDKGNFDTEKINQEREEKNNMGEMFVGAFIGALFTGIVTLFIERDKQKKEDEKEESHAASVLLYDLKSIEKYLVVENSSVNLRYTMDWQGMIASCSFLKSQQIQYIYEIYDQTYNYNYYYKLKENKGTKVDKEEIPQYKELKKLLFDSTKGYIDGKKYNLKYEEIQNELKKHILQ